MNDRNDWLKEHERLVLAYKDAIFDTTGSFLDKRRAAFDAVMTHARDHVAQEPADPKQTSQFKGDVRRVLHWATVGAQNEGHPDHYQYKLCVYRIREALEWTR